jgi:hypothetical protein
MRTFTLTFFGSLFLVAAFNFGVDRAHRWHRFPNYFSRNWTDGEVWVSPADFDEGEFRARHLRLIDPPELLALGSSRVLLIDSRMFRPGIRFYNAGVSAASVEDFIAFWQILKERGHPPRRVIVFLDPWIFFSAYSPSKSLATIRGYERFLRGRWEVAGAAAAWRDALRSRIALGTSEIGDLLSGEVTAASWRALTAPAPDREPAETSGIVPAAERSTKSSAWRGDGSAVYPDAQVAPKTLAAISAVGEAYASGSHWTIGAMASGEAVIPPALEWLLADMAAAGTRVFLLVPPFQPTALRGLRERAATRLALQRAQNVAAELARRFRLPLCDRTDAAAICQPREFMDGYHMLRPCAERIVRSCWQPDPEWRSLLAESPDLAGGGVSGR